MPPRTLLFTSTVTAPFVDEDLAILRRHVRVERVSAGGIGGVIRILSRVPRVQITYTWFASVYAAVAVAASQALRKPSVIVVGGVDVARHPDIGYGLWVSAWKGVLSGYALRHADRVLVVDSSLTRLVQERAGYDGANVLLVPTGYDAAFWTPSGAKRRSVLTVAACSTRGRVRVKGLDFLSRVAAAMPGISFRLIGIDPSMQGYVRSFSPPNLEILPPVARRDLLRHYRESKVYCQPSLAEGLPNCVCEAMLCGAYPVGTTAGGIPTAIGPTGRCVPFGDVEGLSAAIQEGLDAPGESGEEARARVASEFTLERRERSLMALLEELQ